MLAQGNFSKGIYIQENNIEGDVIFDDIALSPQRLRSFQNVFERRSKFVHERS